MSESLSPNGDLELTEAEESLMFYLSQRPSYCERLETIYSQFDDCDNELRSLLNKDLICIISSREGSYFIKIAYKVVKAYVEIPTG